MSKGTRNSFKYFFIRAAMAIAVIGAAMLVDFSPASLRQNFPATKQAISGLPGAVNRPAGLAASPAHQLVANYGKLPLSFEANAGQTDGRVKFLSHGRGYALFLTGDEAVLRIEKSSVVSAQSSVAGKSPSSVVSGRVPVMKAGQRTTDHGQHSPHETRGRANASAAVTGAAELPGKSNYFIGNDPKKWRTNVPTYAQVKYQGVYPGVGLVYYGNQGGQLEYDFVVAPGADPSVIALDVAAGLSRHLSSKNGGVKPPLQIAADGDLVIKTDGGEVLLHKPVVYQKVSDGLQRTTDDGQRTAVEGHYVLTAANQIHIALGPYDHTKPLVIDPVYSYSTYLGGSNYDVGYGIAVDSSGNAYVTGWTQSTNFPTTTGAFQTTFGGGGSDSFVTKLNAAGTALVYSTYLGGTLQDLGYGIAVDSSGNAYVTGLTYSSNFPTVNPFQSTCGNCSEGYSNVFVTKLNATGSALIYSTYLGGTSTDQGYAIAVDPSGLAYVTGHTDSTNFPTTTNALQTTYGGDYDAFVTQVSSAAAPAVTFSTNPLAFGSVPVNSTSTLSLTITNSGTASLGITNFYFSSGSPPFTFASGGTCDTDGQSLAAQASCTAEITFAPTETGLSTGTFGITDNASGSPQSVSLTGTGTTPPAPVAGISPPSLTFSSQNVGTMSVSQPVTLSDLGNAALTITNIITSANFGQTNTCGSSVVVSGSCTINVTFTPTATCSLSGTLTVTDNSNGVAGSTQTVTLGGTGTGVATGSLSAPSLSFTNQPISTTSTAQTETVTNTGTINLTITSATIGGTNASDFAKSADTCTGATVAPNGTCTVSVTFTPAATGARSGTLTFTDNNNNVAGSTQIVALSGVGVDFAVASPNGAQTVAQGGSAQYTINVTSLVGGTDSSAVTMTCSNLPAQATCAFSPNPVTPGANGATTQMTIAIAAPVYARVVPPSTGLPPAALPALLLATVLLTLVGWWRVRRKSPRWAVATCLLFGALLVTTFMAGWGAGGYPLPKVGGTPAGSYTVTITGTSGSTSHSTTVTLTVVTAS